jgi:hypothetical protein
MAKFGLVDFFYPGKPATDLQIIIAECKKVQA